MIKFNTLKPNERAMMHSATLIYKHLKGQTPAYLNDLFAVNNSNTRANGNFQVNKPRTEFDKRAFGYSAILFWNGIPKEIVDSPTVAKFKNELKNWLKINRHIRE